MTKVSLPADWQAVLGDEIKKPYFGELMDFVAKIPHSEAMTKISPFMGPTRITRWKAKGAELPPRWNVAMQRAVGAADARK